MSIRHMVVASTLASLAASGCLTQKIDCSQLVSPTPGLFTNIGMTAKQRGQCEKNKTETQADYRSSRHGWKMLHASTAYWGTLYAAERIVGRDDGVVGYLGRIVTTPLILLSGVVYEIQAAFWPLDSHFPLDQQSLPNWVFDTAIDLVANTYGQLVALVPGVSGVPALRVAGYFAGPDDTVWGRCWYKLNPPNGGYVKLYEKCQDCECKQFCEK